jgi:ribosomal protein S18 acetylase RimI-like enzyme
MISDSDLLALADANLVELAREHARWLPGHEIRESDELLLAAGGTRYPAGPWNSATALGPGAADPERVLSEARAFFAARARGFSVYAPSHLDHGLAAACERAGFLKVSDSPGMALTQRVAQPALGAAVVVRAAEDAADAQAFVDIAAHAYETQQLPAAVTRKLLSHPERWLRTQTRVQLLFQGEQPMAAAMLVFSHGIAGVYWVGTLPQARGRGYAEAVTRAISNQAFAEGARAVVLQASTMGEPVYRRIGYREFTRYPMYVALRAQPG